MCAGQIAVCPCAWKYTPTFKILDLSTGLAVPWDSPKEAGGNFYRGVSGLQDEILSLRNEQITNGFCFDHLTCVRTNTGYYIFYIILYMM